MSIEKSLNTIEVMALEMALPVVLDAEMPVRAVLRHLREFRSGYVLLTTGGNLAGIFTERDALYKVLGAEAVLEQPVSAVMTAHPISVTEHDPISQAIHHMHHGGFRQMAVIDENRKVVGCVRHKDVIHYLVEHFADHVLNLPPNPAQVASSPEGG